MRHAKHRLPADLDAPARSRRLIEEWAAGHDRLHSIVLSVSEIVTNAVTHGASAVDVRLGFTEQQSLVRVVVAHEGRAFDPKLDGGHTGLSIVDRIVDRWGIEQRDDTVEVWFEVDDVPADTEAPSPFAHQYPSNDRAVLPRDREA